MERTYFESLPIRGDRSCNQSAKPWLTVAVTHTPREGNTAHATKGACNALQIATLRMLVVAIDGAGRSRAGVNRG
jgi:hypothetical protein